MYVILLYVEEIWKTEQKMNISTDLLAMLFFSSLCARITALFWYYYFFNFFFWFFPFSAHNITLIWRYLFDIRNKKRVVPISFLFTSPLFLYIPIFLWISIHMYNHNILDCLESMYECVPAQLVFQTARLLSLHRLFPYEPLSFTATAWWTEQQELPLPFFFHLLLTLV